jgi:hypothetical protein
MALQANVTLTDAAATPLGRVFVPQGLENGISRWRYLTASQAGYNWLTQRVVTTKEGVRISYELMSPLLEAPATSGASSGYVAPDKAAYYMRSGVWFFNPSRSVLQDKKDSLAMTLDLAGEGVVQTSVWYNEKAW